MYECVYAYISPYAYIWAGRLQKHLQEKAVRKPLTFWKVQELIWVSIPTIRADQVACITNPSNLAWNFSQIPHYYIVDLFLVSKILHVLGPSLKFLFSIYFFFKTGHFSVAMEFVWYPGVCSVEWTGFKLGYP